MRDAREELGGDLPTPGDASGPLGHAGSVLSQVTWTALSVLEHLDEDDPRAGALTALALRANDLEDEVRRHALALRAQRHAGVEQGIGRLRRLRTSNELIDRVCQEIVTSCGFTRSMLSRVQGDAWHPWMVHFKGEPEAGREFLSWIRDRAVTLDELPLEASVVAERRPEIVVDAPQDPRTYKPLVASGQITSYVVAPIIPAGRVVGLLHADHGHTGRPVDRVDRDVLWTFAEAFGRIYERVVLLERIRAQRSYVRETFEVAESMMASLASAEIELDGGADDASRPVDDPALESPPAPAEIDELLTRREKEVLTMMVRGYSTSAISERLVIKAGTVKSHIKHILRKLGAVNRAEAIARYMGTER